METQERSESANQPTEIEKEENMHISISFEKEA
jgi:hypothetical protein